MPRPVTSDGQLPNWPWVSATLAVCLLLWALVGYGIWEALQ